MLIVIGAVAVGLAIIAILTVKIEFRETPAICAHLASHPSLSDEEYLAGVPGGTDHPEIALGVRDALSWEFTALVPDNTLHPSDTLEHVADLAWDGLCFPGIITHLEAALEIKIPRDLARSWRDEGWEKLTIADLTERVVVAWDRMKLHKDCTLRERIGAGA